MKYLIDNLHDLDQVAKEALNQALKIDNQGNSAVVLALYGDLGSGKTTFTKSLARILDITETVTSPTFVIQKNFNIKNGEILKNFQKLIHIDTYRIDLQDELIKLGWHQNVADDKNLIVVEWPENVEDILPENTIRIYFQFVDETTREIEIKS